MIRFVASLALLLAFAPAAVQAQSSPNWSRGYVPSAGEINNAFAKKQDKLQYTPLSQSGGTMTGKLQAAPATINGAGLSILPGIAPTAPSNGDLWSTGIGLYGRIGGRTLAIPGLDQNTGALLVPGGPTLGTYQNNQFTSQPYNIQLQGPGSTGPVDGMSVGGATLGGGLLPSILTLLTPAQVADVRSGSPTIDLSGIINTALNLCVPGLPPPALDIPRGIVVGVAAPVGPSTCAAKFNNDGGIKQIAAFGSTNLRYGVVQINPGGAGSQITGSGFIDGNRTALVDAYLALPTGNTQPNGLFAIPTEWNCALINAADDVKFDGQTLKNCMVFGLDHAAGQRARISNITVFNTADMIQSIYSDGTSWTNIRGFNLGNKIDNTRAVPWGYASGGNDLTNFTVSGLSITGYQTLNYDGTSTARNRRIGDPAGGYFMFQRVKNATLTGLVGDGFDFSNSDARATNVITGIACDNCYNTAFSNVILNGVYYGFLPSGGVNVALTNFAIDGKYNTAPASGMQGAGGIMAQAGGQIRGNAGIDSSYDHVANAPTRNLLVDGGIVTRSATGVFIATSNVAVRNVKSTGNTGVGVLTWSTGQFFPGGPFQAVKDIDLANIESTYNGGSGYQFNDILRINGSNLTGNNNGQECAVTSSCNGFQFTPGFGGLKSQAFFTSWRAIDNQADAITATASFAPGSSAAGGTYPIVLTDNTAVHVGQYLTLTGAASGDANVTGKVVDVTENIVTLKTASATTFDPSTKLVSKPGTISIPAGTNLATGSGTAFTTAFTGPGYILVGGQYLLVGQVLSDTLIQLDTAPTSTISGASYSVVRTSVAGVPSQRVGFNAPSDPNISNISLGPASAYQAFGNLTANISVAPSSIYPDWTNYTPTFTTGDGSGVSFSGGGSYKVDGKSLCMRGFTQVNYSTAPTSVGVSLPNGLTTLGGGTVTGFSDSGALLIGIGNSAPSVSLRAATGTLLTASGQYIQYNGCMQVQ